jgi:hypothetical protein
MTGRQAFERTSTQLGSHDSFLCPPFLHSFLFYSISNVSFLYPFSWLFSVAWPWLFGVRGEYSQWLLLTGITNFKRSQLLNVFYLVQCFILWGTRWRSWLRHCTRSRKVAGSNSESVIGISHWHNPSIRLRWSRGSVLAFSTQVRGFKPGRSCRIFKGEKILACPPSEGK